MYGIESKLDKEGAGEVVQSWAQSKSSQPPQDQKSFPATNREALKNGCITAASQRDYGRQFPVMKQNPKQANRQKKKLEDGLQEKAEIGSGEVLTQQEHQPPQVFGIQSKKNKASITELLRCSTTELGDETDYPDLSGKQRKGRLPPGKATKSSLIIAKCRQPLNEEELAQKKSIEEFKMKKFKNVQPRIKCYM